MTEISEVSVRLTVLETVVRQLITHMAVREEDPPRWVQTRKTLAMSVIETEGPDDAALLHEAMAEFFDQAEMVARNYRHDGRRGTGRPILR